MSTPNFAPVTRLITVNSSTGSSSFLVDDTAPPSQPLGPQAQLTYLYSAPASVSIEDSTDLAHHKAAPTTPPLSGFPPAGASACVIVEFGPNPDRKGGPMHRTETLDYVVVLEGELELTLDEGTKKLGRGDVVMQRASMHSWKNLSPTASAKIFAVAIGSAGAVEGGMEFAS